MIFENILPKFAIFIILTAILSFATVSISAQETPLSLSEVLTALRSTSSDMTLSQKNSFISERVSQRGVTFTLTPQLATELKNVGASTMLIAAIDANGPQSDQTSTTKSTSQTPDAEFSKLWVEQDVTREGRTGMVIHTAFTAYNLNDIPLQLTVRFQDSSGEVVKSANQNFSNKSGELALFRNVRPGFDAVVYKDLSLFVPYSEIQLNPGTHKLRINADVVYPDGKLLKHLTLYEVTVLKSAPSTSDPRAKFESMWVDYDVTENKRLGMRIHTKLKTYNLKNTPCWLTISFEKGNGERLIADNTFYADRIGGVTVYLELTPGSSTSFYNDISVFMPYDELNLEKGSHDLKMHADLKYPDGGMIQHLNYYPFTFAQP